MEFRLSKGHFLGLFCAVVWGATFISTKVLLEYLSPLQILFSRFLLGYIALWCLYPHRSPKYGRKAQLLFALAGFLGTFLYFLEFSHARERCSHRCERLKNLVVH